MAAVALINSTHKMNGSSTRPLREQNLPPTSTQGKSFQKIRNIHESLRAGLAKRSSVDLRAEGEPTVKLSKAKQRDADDGKRRLLGLGLRRTESKAGLGQGGARDKPPARAWTPFRAPTLRIATLSSPDLKDLANGADITPSIEALISAPKTKRPSVHNITKAPPPSTPSRRQRSPSPVSPSPTPRRRPTVPSSPRPDVPPETRSRSTTLSTQAPSSASVSRTTSPVRSSRPPPPLLPPAPNQENEPLTSAHPSSPRSGARSPSSPPITSRAPSRGHHPHDSVSSLAAAPFREEIRAAASFIVKELSRQPPQIKDKDWIEVEMRLRPLVRAERMWAPNAAGAVTGSQFGSPSSGGAVRERRVFGDALRDGVVLCQLMNKLRPGIVSRVGYKEDGSRNIRNFLYATARYGADPSEMFQDEDLLESTPEAMGSVANALLYLAQLIEEERQSLVVIHDGGKAKSTLYVSASRIVSKTEPVQFDEKPGGTSQANGGRSPYGTLGRQMGVMSNPELASKARAISPAPSTKGRDKSPPPKISPPVPLGHRPSQHRHNGSTVRPNRTPAGSPIPSAPSSPGPAPLSRTTSHSPRMTRVVIPESRRTSSPLLDRQRNEGRRSSNGSRPLSTDSNAPPPPPSRSPDRMGPPSIFAKQRQSATSIVTNSSLMTESTAAFSSLLDFRSGGYGTMRTTTTEATSPSSGIPSFSRSEANEAAKAVLLADSPKAMRRRLSDIGNPHPDRSSPLSPSPEDLVPGSSPSHLSHLRLSRRDRRSSEAAVDLTRVNEESEEPSVPQSKLLARRRSKILDGDPSKRVARKWPEDFDSALEVDSNPIEELERELMCESNSSTTHLEAKPPPALAPIRIPSTKADVPQPLLSDDSRPSRPILVPRRSKRYSADSGIIPSPREGLLRTSSRDGSPTRSADSSGLGVGRPPMLRQPSSRNGKRVYVPKGSTPPSSEISERFLGQRASPVGAGPSPLSTGLPLVSQHVPFPRTASAEFSSGGASRLPTLPSSSETLREDAAEKEQPKEVQPTPEPRPQRPHVPRGRHQSEFDSQRKKTRPGSMDEVGVRRSRIESMFEGVRSEERLSQSPPPPRGQIPRRVLAVKEEGQPAVHYSLGDCIGKGQFGSVYRALNLTTGQMVAVKQLALDGLSADEVKSLKKEVDLLKSLSHPSIVKYEGMAQDEEHLSIVLEYVENGSLGQTLKAFGKLNEKLVASYVIRILEGLHYLHQCSVVHCDLKAANILTTKNGNVKLSDFGVSLNLHAMERVNEVAGTPNWMAPEVIELKGASTKSDIWSLGCVVVELLTGRPPYGDIPNGLTVMFRIVEDERPPIPDGFSPMLRNFLELCFNKDPDLRPSAAILFEHPWLKQKWGAYKELRPQDSIPFLRRVSADLQRSDAVRQLTSSLDPNFYNGGALEDSQYSPLARPTIAIPHFSGADTPLEHHFSTNSFGKPMDCNICYEPVRKHALICDHCRIIVHLRCKAESSILVCERRHGMRSPRYDGSTPHSPTSGILSSSPPSHPETLLRASPSGYNKIVGNWKKRSSRTGSPEPGQNSHPTSLAPGRTPSIAHSRDSDDRVKNRSSLGSTRRASSLHSAATGVSASAATPEPVPSRAPAPQRIESKPRQQHRRQVSEAPSTRPPSGTTGTRSDVSDRRIRKRDSHNTKQQDGCVLQ
ncbi:Cytokinesis protein sepH OS=Aspergillus niger (strain CBS 513,88 / FGSC A1513) GN=sepH PE=3 SV=1 [Rhizoctonia solani AG-1 IB]|uniref:Cytokinesis protein sepH n=1 Tax=Thanatephorus cucumeris (strain AG1-IB / isolate 7/3/14) TaxID=1108050 RepID=A0A0B7FYG0_THACB|nr:Cytokinesis protein sepH OS=Aspergillus niger (strain CBS 513,88 / FGSC A1513) GN=sepH PE=3 SV=1 [Rhizoctonia solani AG-1 IB]